MAYQQNSLISLRMFLIGSIIFFAASRLFVLRPGTVEHVTSYILFPVIMCEHHVIKPIKKMLENRKTIDELTTIIDKYRQDNSALLAENIALVSTALYLEDYKELYEYEQRYSQENVVQAHVIVQNFSQNMHYLLLDKGHHAGVKVDMVAVHNNCLLGRVVEVYPYYCKIILITDPSCKIAAVCAKTHAQGIHEGLHEFNATAFTFVSHLNNLEVGDMIISKGDGLIFPHGFGLGRIKSYKLNEFSYVVEIEPLIDVRSISVCSLVYKK
ncbi:MAG: rod shape-determining protein MreC [Candidatus Babeliaceae bacterium]|jgi:rod shape-determining protein MreC